MNAPCPPTAGSGTVCSRRSALSRLLASAAAAVVAPLARPDSTRNPLWKTAVGLNGFESAGRKYGRTYPIWEVLDFARHEEFDGIELVQGWPMGDYPAAEEAARIRALKRLYDGFGLRVFSLQLGAGGAFAPESEARQQWLDEFRDRVQLARQLGCDCIGLWPGGGLRGQSLDEALDRLAGSFREAGRIAADHGLIAAFEIEPPFVFNTAEHLLRIHREADHPALKVIYDPSHYDLMNGSTGRPHELLQRVGIANIGYLHFTDTDGALRDGGTSKHLPMGDGHAQLPESLRRLREAGWRGWIMVDAWEIPDPYDACRKAKRMLDAAAAAGA
ncbi:MAG: sugar phosphate isomerase/epimerase [Verrucomicrobiae bacterium]|nr:sugar phosphate isomerase/epimerase [Verrucomicrobiae bacterium]